MEKIIEIAKRAGAIITSAHCNADDVDEKTGVANFVTKYDVEVQHFLKKELSQIYPDANFVGEEKGEDQFKGADTVIVVDPIDGTTNFIRGTHHSCVSIGIMKESAPYIAVIYDPYSDELFYAKKGEGAYLNGKRIHVSKQGLENSLVGFGTCPYYEELRVKTIELINDLLTVCGDVRRQGSAALDLCYVACGRFDLFFEYKLSLWDFCAGALIVTEAGGIIKSNDDKDLTFNGPSAIIAANPKAYSDFTRLFNF